MSGSPLPEYFAGLLADHLAKLNQQLRHLLAGGVGPTPVAAAGPAHSVISRLRVAASLLADPEVSRGAELAPLQRLGLVVGELVGSLSAAPDRMPGYLLPPLRQLADFLSEVFERLDDGEAPAEICRDGHWDALLASFINAGTVLQAMDEVEERLHAWSRRYADQDLSASQEEALRRRWTLLRNYGDTLFGVAAHPRSAWDATPAASRSLAGRSVLMLLDSPFRRAQLQDRLREAGCSVETVRSPGGMMARVGDPIPPDILLCDNLEPSLHLITVRKQLEAIAAVERPPLVLIATVGGSSAKLRERAVHLGAKGTWADPFRPEDLASVLE